MITNFLTELYVFLYRLSVIYAALLSYFNDLKWFLFMAYVAVGVSLISAGKPVCSFCYYYLISRRKVYLQYTLMEPSSI